jgi:aryl-alcohol dehydrogenase-like predicted oxidoreductase
MKSGFTISKMTLGTVQLGLDYGIANNEGKPDESKAFRIIESALENGINCLDTAAAYGDSEKVIGNYLHSGKRKRSDIIIVTKFKLGQTKSSDIESVIIKSIERSLKNLNTDWIDILLAHDAKEVSLYPETITKVLEKLLSSGTIRMAGSSCYEFCDIEPVLDNTIFQAFQIPVNILDIRITRGVGADKLRNKLVFARSVFLQGLFFVDTQSLKGNLKEAGKYITALKNIAAEMDISVSELAVKYVRSLPYIDSLVIGADNPEQVIKNVKHIDSDPFPQEILNSIEKRLKGAPEWLFMPYLWDKQKDN